VCYNTVVIWSWYTYLKVCTWRTMLLLALGCCTDHSKMDGMAPLLRYGRSDVAGLKSSFLKCLEHTLVALDICQKSNRHLIFRPPKVGEKFVLYFKFRFTWNVLPIFLWILASHCFLTALLALVSLGKRWNDSDESYRESPPQRGTQQWYFEPLTDFFFASVNSTLGFGTPPFSLWYE